MNKPSRHIVFLIFLWTLSLAAEPVRNLNVLAVMTSRFQEKYANQDTEVLKKRISQANESLKNQKIWIQFTLNKIDRSKENFDLGSNSVTLKPLTKAYPLGSLSKNSEDLVVLFDHVAPSSLEKGFTLGLANLLGQYMRLFTIEGSPMTDTESSNVFVHELGHILGINHSDCKCSLMNYLTRSKNQLEGERCSGVQQSALDSDVSLYNVLRFVDISESHKWLGLQVPLKSWDLEQYGIKLDDLGNQYGYMIRLPSRYKVYMDKNADLESRDFEDVVSETGDYVVSGEPILKILRKSCSKPTSILDLQLCDGIFQMFYNQRKSRFSNLLASSIEAYNRQIEQVTNIQKTKNKTKLTLLQPLLDQIYLPLFNLAASSDDFLSAQSFLCDVIDLNKRISPSLKPNIYSTCLAKKRAMATKLDEKKIENEFYYLSNKNQILRSPKVLHMVRQRKIWIEQIIRGKPIDFENSKPELNIVWSTPY